jgi:hypothetical protein
MRLARLVALLLSAAAPLTAHDLFFRPIAFHVEAGSSVTIPVLNGTFSRSENAVARDRLADLALVGPGGRKAIDPAAWTDAEPSSAVRVSLDEPGTYVVGAAIKPRLLELPGADFAAYLKEEGIDHVLRDRQEKGRTGAPARERYAKYVKTVLQSGDQASDSFGAVFGHEAEIVLLENPCQRKAGETLLVKALVKGRPLAGYTVFAGGRHPGGDERLAQQRLTTDADGIARVSLTAEGIWYVKLVHMEAVAEPDVDYESRWATISFAVGQAKR